MQALFGDAFDKCQKLCYYILVLQRADYNLITDFIRHKMCAKMYYNERKWIAFRKARQYSLGKYD